MSNRAQTSFRQHGGEATATPITAAANAQQRPLLGTLSRAAAFLDSFHGVRAGSPLPGAAGSRRPSSLAPADSSRSGGSGSGSGRTKERKATDLDVWRLRSLVLVSWSTGLSGMGLSPLYALGGTAASAGLGLVLLTGSVTLVCVPWLYRMRHITDTVAGRVVAGTAVLTMTVLTIGSGGFPMGLAPGVQRILPILVLCFGSFELGAAVTAYVVLETLVLQAIGPIPAVVSDVDTLNAIIAMSWALQPILLLLVGASLHVAGSQTVTKLEAVSEAKTRFLSVVSHELRTPLHGILGTCEMALAAADDQENSKGDRRSGADCTASTRPEQSPSSDDALHTIQIAADHLSGIVEDLLLYSSSSAIRINEKRFSVHQLFDTARATLSSTASGFGSPLKFEIATHLQDDGLWFLGDELRLRQCIINVVGNALKFCPGGTPVKVRLVDASDLGSGRNSRAYRPSLGRRRGQDQELTQLVLLIQDEGPGIDPSKIESIFRPFERGSGGANDLNCHSIAGVGLGLSIVSELLGMMGGNVRCESKLGRGATFFLTLKLPRAVSPSVNDFALQGSRQMQSPGRTRMRSATESKGDTDAVTNANTKSVRVCSKAVALSPASKQPLSNGPELETKARAVAQRSASMPVDSTSKASLASSQVQVDPIVIATTNDLDLTPLSPNAWNGESGLFDIRSDSRSWDDFVESIRDASPILSIDAVLFDGSDEAAAAAVMLRESIDSHNVPSVPLLRVCEDTFLAPARNGDVTSNAGNECDPFDCTVHPQAVPALARGWHRALALGAWILVVDDVALNRRVLRSQLARLGHRVTEACDGLEACEAAEAAGYAMDMIAMDLMMPVMDGTTAAKTILKRERIVRGSRARPCPIFAVTAGDKGLLRSEEDASAFCGFLRKPTSVKKLRGTVRYQVIRRLLPEKVS